MDIIRSLELESFLLTKLTKPSIPVNLVGPQVSHPLWWVPASRGVFIFLCVIRRHFLACEDIVGGSDLSAKGTFFTKYRGPSGGSQMSGGGIISWAGEARISEIEEETRHPLDENRTTTTATTVC